MLLSKKIVDWLDMGMRSLDHCPYFGCAFAVSKDDLDKVHEEIDEIYEKDSDIYKLQADTGAIFGNITNLYDCSVFSAAEYLRLCKGLCERWDAFTVKPGQEEGPVEDAKKAINKLFAELKLSYELYDEYHLCIDYNTEKERMEIDGEKSKDYVGNVLIPMLDNLKPRLRKKLQKRLDATDPARWSALMKKLIEEDAKLFVRSFASDEAVRYKHSELADFLTKEYGISPEACPQIRDIIEYPVIALHLDGAKFAIRKKRYEEFRNLPGYLPAPISMNQLTMMYSARIDKLFADAACEAGKEPRRPGEWLACLAGETYRDMHKVFDDMKEDVKTATYSHSRCEREAEYIKRLNAIVDRTTEKMKEKGLTRTLAENEYDVILPL